MTVPKLFLGIVAPQIMTLGVITGAQGQRMFLLWCCLYLRLGWQCCSDSCSGAQANAPVVQLPEVLAQPSTADMVSRGSNAHTQQACTKVDALSTATLSAH